MLTGNAKLQYAAGSQISAIGSGAGMTLTGAQARVATLADPTSNAALTTLAANSGTAILADGAAIASSAPFRNTNFVDLDGGYGSVGGSSFKVASLTNSGTLTVGGLALASTVTTGALTNTGTINLSGVAAPGRLLMNAAAPSALTGTFNLSGGSLLHYASSSISVIGTVSAAGYLLLDGPRAQVNSGGAAGNSALKLSGSGVMGTLDLENGASLATGQDYSNNGILDVDTNYGAGGSSLSVGYLTNNNATGITIHIGNSGLAVATTVSATALNLNSGVVVVAGNPGRPEATLNLKGRDLHPRRIFADL